MTSISSVFLALFLSVPANSERLNELAVPPSIQTSFISIDRPLGFAGECTELHAEYGLDAEFQRLDKQYLDAIVEARGIWPDAGDTGEIVLAAMNSEPQWPSCRRDYVQTALRQASTALDDYHRLFREHTVKMNLRGAWAGPIQLCSENVVSTEITTDTSTSEPILFVRLTPGLRARLLEITKRSIGRQLPIRLDGAVIAKPSVHEPIEKGEFQVIGSDRNLLSRLAERAAASC